MTKSLIHKALLGVAPVFGVTIAFGIPPYSSFNLKMPILPRKLVVVTIVSAVLVLVAPLAMSESPAQSSSPPSPIEREFWSSTHQIGTVAAYQAYLNKFPNGFFVTLASAAINKAENTVSSTSPPSLRLTKDRGETDSNPRGAQFNVSKIVGPTKSSAITQQVGDVFHGPGPITVGWFGAKKQIVVPRGEWVLLAAEDSLSTHTPSMSLTSLVLARLEGNTVRSFLLARFNSKAGNSRNSWSDASACESPSPSTLFAWYEHEFWVTQCVKAALLPQALSAKTLSGSIWKEVLQKLTAGDGALPNSPSLLTEMFYTGDSSNYLKVSRIDFDVSLGERALGTPTSSIDLSPAGREKWAKAYSAVAAVGYRKKLPEDELYAGNPATITSAPFPD